MYLHAQFVYEKVQRQKERLKRTYVDTFLVYTFTCNGRLPQVDSCNCEESQYLFWIQNGTTFFRRFDYCKDYNVITLDTINPLTFYFLNRQIIEKEKINKPTYFEVKRTIKGIDSLKKSISVNHACFHQFNFDINNLTMEKEINIFDLDFIKFDNGKKNIYYKYNQNTMQKKLIDLTTNLILQLNKNNKFVIQ